MYIALRTTPYTTPYIANPFITSYIGYTLPIYIYRQCICVCVCVYIPMPIWEDHIPHVLQLKVLNQKNCEYKMYVVVF